MKAIFICIVLLAANAVYCYPHESKVTKDIKDVSDENSSGLLSAKSGELLNASLKRSVSKEDLAENAEKPSDEDMETADMIVFRPLFAYRKQLAKRKRVYVPIQLPCGPNNQNVVRRNADKRLTTKDEDHWYHDAKFPAFT